MKRTSPYIREPADDLAYGRFRRLRRLDLNQGSLLDFVHFLSSTPDQSKSNLMDRPRYIVLDDAPQARGLDCTADDLADALRAPLAAVGVRVIRRRGSITKSLFSEFQARGVSRSKYEAKAIQVARIIDEVTVAYQGPKVRARRALV